MSNTKKPEPIDEYVAARVQQRRREIGMSQETLGGHLGITFQQVQKYEKGANRMSVGRLFSISRALRVTPGYFLDGFHDGGGMALAGFGEEEGQPALEGAPQGDDDILRLVQSFALIKDAQVRSAVADLVAAIARFNG
ncbi:helix-turn-helix domain-containing protein [Aureimonas mangrovi]|uniref:helix-turn-helix domain-containing protein n=1 Tax=Aureimonas mangrovi TaxID=2758041 RepID=UPI001AEDB12E|nr:helix-turn-helix domain-containing protein [Aureimonas mangrovi]